MEFKNGKQNCRWKRYNVRMVKMEFKDGQKTIDPEKDNISWCGETI